MAGTYLIDGGSHLNRMLTNLMMKPFEGGTEAGYIGQNLFPAVPVGRQSDKYYVLDQAYWLGSRTLPVLRNPGQGG